MPPMGGNMAPMSMTMAFNSRNLGTALLFGSWIPETPVAFAFSCLAIAALAACSVGLSRLALRFEDWTLRTGWPIRSRNSGLAITYFVSQTLSYSLMLLAMTFDVSIFFAVIGGLALGALFFSHWSTTPSHASELAFSLYTSSRLYVYGAPPEGSQPREAEGVEVELARHSGGGGLSKSEGCH